MTTQFDKAFARTKQLVTTFKANESDFREPDYSEARVRIDFIDKFWTALGWDVNHEEQKNPYEQEVKVEPSVLHGGSTRRRADYAFYLTPNFRDPRFYVEAKKPAGGIANADDYFQAIRYGWNSEAPFTVLTSFEDLHVLDCRLRPDIDTALNQCVSKYHYSDYADPETFAQIYWLFSREAVSAGSIEKRARDLGPPRGKAVQRGLFPGAFKPVDQSFLQELDEFRLQLARGFREKNHKLDNETLTELAQRTLDRLVFLRFLEDHGIQTPTLVDRFGDTSTAWADFISASRRLDSVYNGVVFKHHPLLDSPAFHIDDKVFADICETIAAVNTPYDFNSIPIYILGSIYERFLGKVIVTTEKQVRLVEKDEVRHAGGVYYTPEYVVRCIVENTVGQLIDRRTPQEISGMRFADIACGSGSFLLSVYDLLLEYHGRYYNTHPSKARRGDCVERDGRLYLSLRKKREILLNNIYGVDIDSQAVEVAQLSLYLRLLQEETTGTARQYQLEFAHTARLKQLLPDLSRNIVCGNSLIGSDIFEGSLFSDEEEERRINAMDFSDRFPDVVAHGGFHAIVGNPPYIRMEAFKSVKDYLRDQYAVHEERSDYYAYFIERAHRLLRRGGRFGMIVSNKFLRANYGRPLRAFIAKNARVNRVVDFAGLPVFRDATVRTIVLTTTKGGTDKSDIIYSPPPSLETFASIESGLVSVDDAVRDSIIKVSQAKLDETSWTFVSQEAANVLERLTNRGMPLREYCKDKICMGVKSGLKEAFEIDADTRRDILRSNPEAEEIIKPFVNGRDVRRYHVAYNGGYFIYAFHGVPIDRYPAVRKHLEPYRGQLKRRATSQAWYELQQPQLNFAPYMDKPKIIFPDIATEPRFALDEKGFYSSNTTYFIALEDHYLLGLLNSSVALFYFRSVCAGLEGKKETYLRFFGQYLENFPVVALDPRSKKDAAMRRTIEGLVKRMIEASKRLAVSRTTRDVNYYQNRARALDRQIDDLVCRLYGVTAAELAAPVAC